MTIIKYTHNGDEYRSTMYYGSLARPITMDGIQYYGEQAIIRKTEENGAVTWLTNVESLVPQDGSEMTRGPWVEAEDGAIPENVTSRFDTEEPLEEGVMPGYLWVRQYVMDKFPKFVELSTENGVSVPDATDQYARALIDLGYQLLGEDD